MSCKTEFLKNKQIIYAVTQYNHVWCLEEFEVVRNNDELKIEPALGHVAYNQPDGYVIKIKPENIKLDLNELVISHNRRIFFEDELDAIHWLHETQ
jgi:hypothetical protein